MMYVDLVKEGAAAATAAGVNVAHVYLDRSANSQSQTAPTATFVSIDLRSSSDDDDDDEDEDEEGHDRLSGSASASKESGGLQPRPASKKRKKKSLASGSKGRPVNDDEMQGIADRGDRRNGITSKNARLLMQRGQPFIYFVAESAHRDHALHTRVGRNRAAAAAFEAHSNNAPMDHVMRRGGVGVLALDPHAKQHAKRLTSSTRCLGYHACRGGSSSEQGGASRRCGVVIKAGPGGRKTRDAERGCDCVVDGARRELAYYKCDVVIWTRAVTGGGLAIAVEGSMTKFCPAATLTGDWDAALHPKLLETLERTRFMNPGAIKDAVHTAGVDLLDQESGAGDPSYTRDHHAEMVALLADDKGFDGLLSLARQRFGFRRPVVSDAEAIREMCVNQQKRVADVHAAKYVSPQAYTVTSTSQLDEALEHSNVQCWGRGQPGDRSAVAADGTFNVVVVNKVPFLGITFTVFNESMRETVPLFRFVAEGKNETPGIVVAAIDELIEALGIRHQQRAAAVNAGLAQLFRSRGRVFVVQGSGEAANVEAVEVTSWDDWRSHSQVTVQASTGGPFVVDAARLRLSRETETTQPWASGLRDGWGLRYVDEDVDAMLEHQKLFEEGVIDQGGAFAVSMPRLVRKSSICSGHFGARIHVFAKDLVAAGKTIAGTRAEFQPKRIADLVKKAMTVDVDREQACQNFEEARRLLDRASRAGVALDGCLTQTRAWFSKRHSLWQCWRHAGVRNSVAETGHATLRERPAAALSTETPSGHRAHMFRLHNSAALFEARKRCHYNPEVNPPARKNKRPCRKAANDDVVQRRAVTGERLAVVQAVDGESATFGDNWHAGDGDAPAGARQPLATDSHRDDGQAAWAKAQQDRAGEAELFG